jgi:CBS domain-containing protein
MIASDVMTRHVISIAPDATVEDAVKMMLAHGISGLFVVDAAGELVGVVTEGDLLRRDELGTERHRPWWLRLLVSPSRQATEFFHAHGHHVRDVMTAQVISVPEDAPLEDVVAAMEKHRIKRVPVAREGRVIGVLSRSDLLRALLPRARTAAPMPADDRAIRTAIMDALEKQPWAPRTTLNATVTDGVVDLWGSVGSDEERHGVRVLAENIPGVKAVHDHLVYIEPYTGTVIDGPQDCPAG